MRRLRDDHAASPEHQAGRQAELIGEDGELVGSASALRVLADDDLVVPLTFRLFVIGVVHGDADPQPATLVPVHSDWLAAQVRLGSKQLHFEIHRRHHVLHRLGRVERLLHFVKRLAGDAPLPAGRIKRDARFDILEWFNVGVLRRHLWLKPRGCDPWA